MTKAAVLGVCAGLIILISPLGPKLVDKLPFVGTVDLQNVEYRERLLNNALIVISHNPYFGSYDFMNEPEMQELRNGGDQGIVDLVNSYIAIALSGGMVGLLLFILPYISTLASLLIHVLRRRTQSDPVIVTGRVLFSILVGIMLMIYTVSSILVIPLLQIIITGLSLNYLRLWMTAQK